MAVTIWQDIKGRVSLLDYARSRGMELKPAGGANEHLALCPFHPDSNPSLRFYPQGDAPHYFCHSCGARGDIFDLRAHFDHSTKGDAVKKWAEEFGIDWRTNGAPKRTTRGRPPKSADDDWEQSPPPLLEWLRRYGLATEDFTAAGFEFVHWEGETRIKTVRYPVRTRSGAALDKFKSYARKGGKRQSYFKPAGVGETGLIGNLDAARGATLVLAGGEEKMLAAVVAGFASVSVSTGEKAPDENCIAMLVAAAPREVIVAYDADEAGRKATRKTAAVLLKAGLAVRVLEWPVGTPDKHDLNDVLRDSGPEALRELLESAKPFGAVWEKPTIQIGTDEFRVNQEALAALAACPGLDIYQRSGVLVSLTWETRRVGGMDVPRGIPTIEVMSAPRLRDYLTRAANWEKFNKTENDWVPSHPPEWCVTSVLELGEKPGIRRLDACVDAPVLRPDGTLTVPGYDPDTFTVCHPTFEMLPIPDFPTREDASKAVAEIEEVVCDFPFAEPCHRSGWLASLLTPFARFAFRLPPPLTLIDANTRGTGKSRLADCVSMILVGQPMPRTTNTENQDEMEKRVVSLLLSGVRTVFIDNVSGLLGGEVLDCLLTAPSHKGRVLGVSKMPNLTNNLVWYATGNNVEVTGDLTRRIVHVRLESPEEHPEDRTGFRHPDLLDWIAANRPRLVRAALVILRAFTAAGRPLPKGFIPTGSFEDWSRLVRGALLFAGCPDPADAKKSQKVCTDPSAQQTSLFLAILKYLDPMQQGMIASDIIAKLEAPGDTQAKQLYDSLRSVIASKDGRVSSLLLGKRMSKVKDRVIAGFKLVAIGKDRNDSVIWAAKRLP